MKTTVKKEKTLKQETKKVLSGVVIAEKISPKHIWKHGDGQQIEMIKMDKSWMEKCKRSLQMRILAIHDKIEIYQKLVDQLDEAAEFKGIELKELESGHFVKDKQIRKAKLAK